MNSRLVSFGPPNSGKKEAQATVTPNIPKEGSVEDQIVQAIKTVYDPEIPLNIYDLGLIYRIEVDDQQHATVDMTLTAPGCPVAGQLVMQVEQVVSAVDEIKSATVNLVWDPPWTQDRMTDEAKLELGLF